MDTANIVKEGRFSWHCHRQRIDVGLENMKRGLNEAAISQPKLEEYDRY
jgi:hypothetical protein